MSIAFAHAVISDYTQGFVACEVFTLQLNLVLLDFIIFCCNFFTPSSNLGKTPAVMAEKSHQQFINGVEAFDKSSMKRTETEEKNPLPDQTGKSDSLSSLMV